MHGTGNTTWKFKDRFSLQKYWVKKESCIVGIIVNITVLLSRKQYLGNIFRNENSFGSLI